MSTPAEVMRAIDAFPRALRALVEAELAAGNEIVEVGSSFPAPPTGYYVKLARPVTTRPRVSDGELAFYDRNGSTYSGEWHDERRFHFVLEPPHPPEPEPDMDAIRRARQPEASRGRDSPPAADRPADPVGRFARSMEIDYERWHDGIGYDLDALAQADAAERTRIAALLRSRGVQDWRDVEALARLGTDEARDALRRAVLEGGHEIRLAVMREAPRLVSEEERTDALVAALEEAEFYGGLSRALDMACSFHPPPVVEALLRGALQRAGEVAVHCAALLYFLHGRGREPFDMDHRPFFLRFNAPAGSPERNAAFRDLCCEIDVAPEPYVEG